MQMSLHKRISCVDKLTFAN